MQTRFKREARAAAQIDSDHVARVTDIGTLGDGTPFMVIDYLDGVDLETALERRGPFSQTVAIRCVLEAAQALAVAHRQGIVHRDLKPANLFLAKRQDGSVRVKVFDFGISKFVTEYTKDLTQTRELIGSPLYMAPEQLLAPKLVDRLVDIWALGTILFELLTGTTPFTGNNLTALFSKVMQAPAPRLTDLLPTAPEGLALGIEKSLAKKPADRHQSIAEFARAIAPYGDGDCQLIAAMIQRINDDDPDALGEADTHVIEDDNCPPPLVFGCVSASQLDSQPGIEPNQAAGSGPNPHVQTPEANASSELSGVITPAAGVPKQRLVSKITALSMALAFVVVLVIGGLATASPQPAELAPPNIELPTIAVDDDPDSLKETSVDSHDAARAQATNVNPKRRHAKAPARKPVPTPTTRKTVYNTSPRVPTSEDSTPRAKGTRQPNLSEGLVNPW